MADKAALVTGASSGIGLAIARTLGEMGYGLTMVARRPAKLEEAAAGLEAEGIELQAIAADVAEEDQIVDVVKRHEERYGRMDVLINNAGVGFGELGEGLTTKRVDMQLAVNLRSIFLFYRESIPMLKKAGEEHGSALVVNLSSISGIRGEAFLSVYSATKHGVVGFTQAMNKELGQMGIRNTAFCPGFVDTPMTDFIKEHVPAEEMMRPEDMAAAVRFLLEVSPGCMVPEIQFEQPGGLQLPGVG